MVHTAGNDTVTLRLPPDPEFAEIPRVTLASLLRIHQIDPGELGDLGTSIQKAAGSITQAGHGVEINFRVTADEVLVTVEGGGNTVDLAAHRG
ncbi:MAG: hypothetical protein CL406_02620 [Acidimicrobiaceae bacterium]|jgi:hypothetical protein|nr:hypothetical protein [Acidimicrobiaceae bacterium]MBS1265823.1 hypothetical protein [Acidimicrobiaceae bacterium]MDP6480830.1 hypothetical protein [Acidimicrobiales bacterium]MDP6696520.1 hypothetical protein [Acidimicrobiales bacterium]|tara:strand:+ start:559 stop:837 length:279 start_codon:yes stop_codon:yes gene_type:complete